MSACRAKKKTVTAYFSSNQLLLFVLHFSYLLYPYAKSTVCFSPCINLDPVAKYNNETDSLQNVTGGHAHLAATGIAFVRRVSYSENINPMLV